MDISKIYFDMDGVVADFDRGVRELCGLPVIPYSEMTEEQDDKMWAVIKTVGHFYDKLEPIPGAIELFRAVYDKYRDRCEILTGIPKAKRGILTAGDDKIAWAHRLLAPGVAVNIVYAQDKPDFCKGVDCILIDDLESNIRAWENCGGTGILHKSPEQTMAILKDRGIL